jgi:hypothetical protein
MPIGREYVDSFWPLMPSSGALNVLIEIGKVDNIDMSVRNESCMLNDPSGI